MTGRHRLFVLVAAALCSWLAPVNAVKPVVDLGYTKYRGTDNCNGVSQWLGIRYAAPPVGNLRFQKPQDPQYTKKIQDAVKHGHICLGTDAPPNEDTFKSQSEDCLFLDVYAPTDAGPRSKLPVYFFIQGGGFSSNSNSNYNGTGLVKAGDLSLIVVTFNYRVGPYGFLTNGDEINPNNGLWDQVKALEWVQEHIAKFGGDPDHVVIGGDSAGAGSVSYHLTRDGGKDHGLFVGAVGESVSFSTIFTVDESQYLYDSFAVRAGCAVAESLACLRSKSTKELQAANVNVQPWTGAQEPPLFAWNPVIDGDFIAKVTYDAYAAGEIVKVPIIMGDDTNGGTSFVPRDTQTIPEMNKFLHNQFPFLTLADLETIDSMYPNPNKTCPSPGCRWRQTSDAYAQMRYMCSGLFINEQYALNGVRESWAYRWNVEDPAQMAEGLGVPHTVEVNAVFGAENTNGGAPESYYRGGVNEHAVDVAQAYWTSFVRTLDPNKHRLPGSAKWQTYSESRKQRILVNTGGKTTMEPIDRHLERACKFFAKIGSRIKQ